MYVMYEMCIMYVMCVMCVACVVHVVYVCMYSWALINPIGLVRSVWINSTGVLESRRICVVASHCIRIRFGSFVIAPFVWL